jgi:hypothetical protein
MNGIAHFFILNAKLANLDNRTQYIDVTSDAITQIPDKQIMLSIASTSITIHFYLPATNRNKTIKSGI